MKQFQLEQVKFPKPSSNAVQRPVHLELKKPKSNAHSEMIRIIIALLIAIFIYNSSQQTTINYNEIIKNQKMFLVKNIRGVLPTLSGNIRQLQRKWKVVHFQNFLSNYSEVFNNYTFTFNHTKLLIENSYCNFNISYEWKNYSYNIDFKDLQTNETTRVKINQQSSLTDQNNNHVLQNEDLLMIDQNNKQTAQKQSQNSSKLQQKMENSQNSNTVIVNSQTQTRKPTQTTALRLQQKQKQQSCQKTKKQFKQVINFTSVWTISDKNLYLLLQNTHLQEDFYLILQPLTV